MIKAIAGGGGRGMRIVDDAAKLEEAYARCQSEAKAAFGSDGVYVERLIRNARHIEVQIIGDHHGAISHLWERECTIQRRNQKLIEVAPSPSLNDALRCASSTPPRNSPPPRNYDNLGTFEFLVDDDAKASDQAFAFIEANPRLQVEHTVTEEVLGIDLVQSQLAVAGRRHAGLARSGAGLYPKAARLCDAAPRQHGGDGRDRRRPGRPAERLRCSTCRPAPAFASIRLATPATGPAPPSTRCSPRSSCIRRRRTGPTSCSKACAHAARVPHRRRRHQHSLPARRSWRIRILSPTASAPVSSIRMSPHLVARGRNDAETALVESGDAADDDARACGRGIGSRAGRLGRGAGAAAGHDRCDRRQRRAISSAPASRSPCSRSMKMEHLVTAPHGGRVTKVAARSRRDADAGRGDPLSRAGRDRRP